LIGHLASLESDNLPTVLGSNEWLQRVTTSSLRQQKRGLRVRLVKVVAFFSLGPRLFRGCGPLGMRKERGVLRSHEGRLPDRKHCHHSRGLFITAQRFVSHCLLRVQGTDGPRTAKLYPILIVTYSAWAYIDRLTLVEGACAGTRS
jgi:hypothetical protein